MVSDRVEAVARQLEHIDDETSTELEELQEAIERVEGLHEEHMEEMEADEEFIHDLKNLYREVRMIRKIEEHLYNGLEAYGDNEITAERFKQLYVEDEEELVEVVNEIQTELEDMTTLIAEEERLTNKDFDKEGAIEELIRALNEEQAELSEAHNAIEETLME